MNYKLTLTLLLSLFLFNVSPLFAQTDSDGDGFDAEVDDCNDNDAAINPNTKWYLDADQDGLGDPNPALIETQCLQPQTAVYVLNGLDPDDSTVDFDNDGLNDGVEVLELGTDPDDSDSDGDGLEDGLEVDVYATDPQNTDSDNDGLSDGDEVNIHGTQPDDPDSDNDDLNDGDEINEATDPLDRDSDNDNLEDGDEVNVHGSNPLSEDSDGESLNDSDEIELYGTDPLDTDTDDDGLNDYEEAITLGTEPTAADIDNDGLNDKEEVDLGTDTYRADSDGDGLDDKQESESTGTDPLNADTDDDGCDDKVEIDDPAKDPLVAEFTTYYQDADEDGFGDPNSALTNQSFCTVPEGYVTDNTDCDDTDVDVFPDAPAKPDGKDNNCDGTIDKVDQTITFSPVEDQVDGGTLALSATSDSGLDIVYEVTGPVEVSGATLTFTSPGKVTVIATQPGDNSYNTATSVEQKFCVNPAPVISTPTNGPFALTLSSNYAAGNQWLLNGANIEGATENEYIVMEAGDYTLNVSIGGCSAISNPFQAIITSLEEVQNLKVELWPNPVRDRLQIQIEGSQLEDVNLTITDIRGSIKSQQRLAPNSPSLDLTELKAGMYFLNIQIGDQIITEKFIKQ